MYLSDDPLRDFDRYDRDMAKEYQRLPFCDECGERIEDDFLYDIDGTLICEKCIEDKYRKQTSDYME